MECYNLSSPSSRALHRSHHFTPSLYCPSSAPPLSLPPSHYQYYDGASYADESIVSSVDEYALLSSVHSTASDELVSHYDAQQPHGDKPLAEEQFECAPEIHFTPALQLVAVPLQVECEDAYGSESSVGASSAAPSPVFQPSFLPPLSPALAGQLSSSSSVHTDLSTHAHSQSNPASPYCDDPSLLHLVAPASVQPLQPAHDTTAAYSAQPSSASIFYEPHTSPLLLNQTRHLLPPPAVFAATPLSPRASFHPPHTHYPVVPLTPPDAVCSAPFLPPVTGSPFPFSPPVPLGQSANGGSGMAASDYVAASFSKLKAAAATIVQTRPSERTSSWSAGAKIELPATKKAASKVASAKKKAAVKKERKRKRDESDDSDSDSDSSDSSSSSSDSDSDADSSTSSTRRRTAASTSSASTPRRKPLTKRERNKMSASAYRKRKKAHIAALHGVSDTLKTTVAQQSDLIESITNENKVLREQLSFIQKLFGSSFLTAQKDKQKPVDKAQEKAKGKDKEKEKAQERVGAPPPVAQPASPKLVAAVAPPAAVAPIATVNESGQVTVLSPEADKLDLAALLLKPAQAEAQASVKRESGEKPAHYEQRATIFMFVIVSCFLLFNPNTLHTPLNDVAFTQLTTSFLNQQYSGGADIPFAACTSTPPSASFPSPLSFLASFSPGSAASLLSPEAVVRHFLDIQLGDESFLAEVLERTYAPLVRLVGEEAAQSAIMRLAGGMLTLQLKRQQAVVAMEGGGDAPQQPGAEACRVKTEADGEVEPSSALAVVPMVDVPIASQ